MSIFRISLHGLEPASLGGGGSEAGRFALAGAGAGGDAGGAADQDASGGHAPDSGGFGTAQVGAGMSVFGEDNGAVGCGLCAADYMYYGKEQPESGRLDDGHS